MAEVIIRQHKRCVDRWMPKKQIITRAQARGIAAFAVRCVPGFLLAFAEMVGIPSGLHAALAVAMAALGLDIRPVLVSGGAAILVRLISGLPPHWEMVLSLTALGFAAGCFRGKGSLAVSIAAALLMMPTAIAGCFSSTAAELVRSWAALVLAGLAAPLFARAVNALRSDRHISALEEQVAVGCLAAMCLCGGARMLLLGINIGMWLSACVVLSMALTLGTSAGALAGMLSGVVLALQGLPLTVAIALSMGGFLAGMSTVLSRRIASGAFAMSAYLPLLLCGGTGMGCGTAVLLAAIAMGLMPRESMEHLQQFLRRFLPNDPAPGDAYAATALSRWEQTVAAMACAVPSPKDSLEDRSGIWWHERLCQGCPEYENCGCMHTGLGITKAEAVWDYRHASDAIWQGAMEHLRGLGCQRLYHLFDSMNALRQEDADNQRTLQQLDAQRNMLVTHLTAMSGAARRFAVLSYGECWWDAMAARRIRRVLDERATPVGLSWVRRVQGHVQAAYELRSITGGRGQAEELIVLTSAVLGVPMELCSLDGERVLLAEQPPLQAEVGIATEPITGGKCCGDTAWTGKLLDGRYLAVLCDGMGHGEKAELASQQAAELLRLCLEAGYSRQQGLTAVNGMLLLGGGERFSTADVLTIDLWRGRATLDKLGAAAAWLWQQGVLTRFTGDALPLGILEEIDLSGSDMRLHDGDAIILLSDGVEEAFPNTAALEAAIQAAVVETSPQDAADELLYSALTADDNQRRDDQSAVVVYIRKNDRALHGRRGDV